MRDGVAHLHFARCFDAADDVAHIACFQFAAGLHFQFQHANFVGIVLASRVEKFHIVARAQRAVHHFEIGDNAAKTVEHRIENKALQRCVGVALWRRNAFYYGIENRLNAQARFAAGTNYLFAFAAEQVHNFVLHCVGHCALHVAFVHHGNYLEIMLDGHVEVADGLRLHALRCVYHQQCALASGYGAAHLVRKIDMPRRINQIQRVFFAVVGVFHLYGVAFDGDAALTLEVHIVQHLRL